MLRIESDQLFARVHSVVVMHLFEKWHNHITSIQWVSLFVQETIQRTLWIEFPFCSPPLDDDSEPILGLWFEETISPTKDKVAPPPPPPPPPLETSPRLKSPSKQNPSENGNILAGRKDPELVRTGIHSQLPASAEQVNLLSLLTERFVRLLKQVFLRAHLFPPTVPQLSLQHSQLCHHLYAEVKEQLHPQLLERVSHGAAHGDARQHHQRCGQGCQRCALQSVWYFSVFVRIPPNLTPHANISACHFWCFLSLTGSSDEAFSLALYHFNHTLVTSDLPSPALQVRDL